MKELRSLTISACPITDLSIAALAQIDLTHLRELRLEKLSGISGSALQQVSSRRFGAVPPPCPRFVALTVPLAGVVEVPATDNIVHSIVPRCG